MIMNIELAKNAAEAFVLRLLPHDRARIVSFDDKVSSSPMFTSNRDDLIRYLHTEMQYGNGTRLWDAVDYGITALSEETNRRVVLVLSDGEDTTSKSVGRDEVSPRAAGRPDDLRRRHPQPLPRRPGRQLHREPPGSRVAKSR